MKNNSPSKHDEVLKGGIETLKRTLEPSRVTSILKDNKEWLSVMKAEA